jgi:two-component system sensor kinase FixL
VSSKPQGMGIGLSICRTIVESHGGLLWPSPNPTGGTIFSFTIQAVSAPDETQPLAVSERPSGD